MINKTVLAVIGAGLMLFAAGCYYDKADQVYPGSDGNCDTSNVRLSVEIESILSANCYRCHGGSAELGSGIQLEDYEVLKAYADNGLLVSAVSHDGGAVFMPKDAAKLPECDISKIRVWVNDGAPNN